MRYAALILAFCLSACAADYTILDATATRPDATPMHTRRTVGKRLTQTQLAAAFAEGFWRARGHDVPDLTIEWVNQTDLPWVARYDESRNVVQVNRWNRVWHRGGRTDYYDSTTNVWHTDLNYVLCHEFGHACGLQHSNDPGNVMYPTFPYAADWRGKRLLDGKGDKL